eukprot:CAMPEP_0118923454 /NCGR_PEP_ID=MMETSP1169-20130426/1976_1 /TAXON_ID=36882 /ORGANISM="Pyramimonas obovata, Strain CCMP722" /LENGTH=73 /DNA_ID=CAMNT_0006864439 /DNA_START=67 /DNA_END=288 /DNA_ORIENTATION=+
MRRALDRLVRPRRSGVGVGTAVGTAAVSEEEVSSTVQTAVPLTGNDSPSLEGNGADIPVLLAEVKCYDNQTKM